MYRSPSESAQDASPIDQHRSRRAMAMARACRPRCLPRPQPGHGVAVCRGARPASSEPEDRIRLAAADRGWPCALDRDCGRPAGCRGHRPAGKPGADRLGPVAARMGRLPLALRPSPSRPLRHADGAVGPGRLVLPDGHGTRRRPHALAGPDAAMPSGRCRREPGRSCRGRVRRRRHPYAGDGGNDGQWPPPSSTNGSAWRSCGAPGSTST